MRKARADSNQKEIVTALRACGAVVKHVHTLKNLFDIIVYFGGRTYSVEIKADNKQKLTKGELECKADLESVNVNYWVIHSIDEAIQMIQSEEKND